VKRFQRGFTLIEILIVVAIIAILAAIAMAAYQQYLKEAQIAKIVSHYDDAIRAVRAELVKRAAQLSGGRNDLVALDETFVIEEILNPEGRATAPLGGPAYLPGASDPEMGAIGVRITGGNRAGTEVVTIARPAFLEDVTAESVTIYANSAR
jgi:type IV pilus assembly protein PilA